MSVRAVRMWMVHLAIIVSVKGLGVGGGSRARVRRCREGRRRLQV